MNVDTAGLAHPLCCDSSDCQPDLFSHVLMHWSSVSVSCCYTLTHMWHICDTTTEKKSLPLVVFEETTPELQDESLPLSTHRTWNDPSACCWHAPCWVCLFLQGSQVILASSLASSNLSKSYCGALSLAEIPAWHAAAPVPASASLPASGTALLYQEGVNTLTIKNRSDFFHEDARSSPSGRWLLRTWQSWAVWHLECSGITQSGRIDRHRRWHLCWQRRLYKQLGLWHWADSSHRIVSGRERARRSQTTEQLSVHEEKLQRGVESFSFYESCLHMFHISTALWIF